MSDTYKFTLDQYESAVLDLVPKLKEAAIKGLRSAAHRMNGEVVKQIDTASPRPAVDEGTLRRSAHEMDVPDGAHVIVDAPHAAVMEFGARPFLPPLEPLVEWILRKGLAEDEHEAWLFANNIALKFQREGIAPRHYFQKAYEASIPNVKEEVERYLEAMRP